MRLPGRLSVCSGYISATQILPPAYLSNTHRIPVGYPAHTSFMGLFCMGCTQKPPKPPSSAIGAAIQPWECAYL